MDKNLRSQHIVAIVVGLIIVAAIVFFSIYLPQLKNVRQTPAPTVTPGLGEIGARCGGELRLPCKPGNECRIADMAKNEGICVKVTNNPAPVKP